MLACMAIDGIWIAHNAPHDHKKNFFFHHREFRIAIILNFYLIKEDILLRNYFHTYDSISYLRIPIPPRHKFPSFYLMFTFLSNFRNVAAPMFGVHRNQ